MTRCLGTFAGVCGIAMLPAQLFCATINTFSQTNLVSDLPGVAKTLDPNLVNPWGMAFSATSPIWVADNHTGVSTLYTGAGQPVPLVVTIPPPSGGMPPAAPTGVVFNGGASFGAARFIFATEDGTISAWSSGTNAVLKVDNSGSGAVYKGLALANNGSDNLYAANFNSGNIDVFNSSFAPVSVAGGFTDANIPAGFAPFDIENVGGKLYVTYARQDADKHDDIFGPGNGFVDVFDTNGHLLQRLVSNGPLNSPWGLALAPMSLAPFGGDLFVGNFGDGKINVFDPVTGNLVGTVDGANGSPIVIPGLWGLAFGNGAGGASTTSLYFTAGIPGPDTIESHGLFGDLNSVPEPGSAGTIAGGLLVLALLGRFRLRRLAQL